jgi:hypothetical protein
MSEQVGRERERERERESRYWDGMLQPKSTRLSAALHGATDASASCGCKQLMQYLYDEEENEGGTGGAEPDAVDEEAVFCDDRRVPAGLNDVDVALLRYHRSLFSSSESECSSSKPGCV